MNRISIAIPYHGRREQYVERNIVNLKHDPRVAEMVIQDDASSIEDFQALVEMLRRHTDVSFDIHVEHNITNLFVFQNKIKAVRRCSEDVDWVALIDSDNVIDSSYLDAWERATDPRTDWIDVFLPVVGRPALDYRAYAGSTIDEHSVSALVDRPHFETLLNTMNFVVARGVFLAAMRDSPHGYEPFTADSIWINYLLLKHGATLYVTPGMEYEHTRHEGSTWAIHHQKGDGENERIKQLLREMK